MATLHQILHKLSAMADNQQTSLVSKSRTESLDELRYQAGLYEGLRAAILLITEEIMRKEQNAESD